VRDEADMAARIAASMAGPCPTRRLRASCAVLCADIHTESGEYSVLVLTEGSGAVL
jgi:hypothetical protein